MAQETLSSDWSHIQSVGLEAVRYLTFTLNGSSVYQACERVCACAHVMCLQPKEGNGREDRTISHPAKDLVSFICINSN